MKKFLILLSLAIILLPTNSIAQNATTGNMVVPYTLNDRDAITRIEGTLIQIEKRMEQLEKRMEQQDKRIDDMRADNKQRVDDLRTDTKEQFDTLKIAFGCVVSIFTALVIFLISIVIRDRKLIFPIEKKLAEIDFDLKEIKKETSFGKVISVFRELAKSNPQIAEILKIHNIL